MALAQRLRATAGFHVRTPSRFLEAKILARAGRKTACAAEAPRRFSWSPALAMSAAVVVLLASATAAYYFKDGQSTAEGTRAVAQEEIIMPVPSLALLPNPEKLLEWGDNLDQPLETELQSVVHDARSALRLLARNFLPDEFRNSLTSQNGQNARN